MSSPTTPSEVCLRRGMAMEEIRGGRCLTPAIDRERPPLEPLLPGWTTSVRKPGRLAEEAALIQVHELRAGQEPDQSTERQEGSERQGALARRSAVPGNDRAPHAGPGG